jgi:hypothetical protein
MRIKMAEPRLTEQEAKPFVDGNLYREHMEKLQFKPTILNCPYTYFNEKRIKVKRRRLIVGEIKIGKTYYVTIDGYNYLGEVKIEEGKDVVTIYLTLNSTTVADQETEGFNKAGFENIIKIDRYTKHNSKWDLESLALIARTEKKHYSTITEVIKDAHAQDKRVHLICDEYDLLTFSVEDYTGNKAQEVFKIICMLDEEDFLTCVSATNYQFLNMHFSFTEVIKIDPYKEGYRSILRPMNEQGGHNISLIYDKDFEALRLGNLTSIVLQLADEASKYEKLGVHVTRFIDESKSAITVTNIAKAFRDKGYKVYEVVGNKEKVPRNDPEYLEAEIVVIGQPGNRAIHLPRMKNYIYDVPVLLQNIEQWCRISGYHDYETTIWTTLEGLARIKSLHFVSEQVRRLKNELYTKPSDEKLDAIEQLEIPDNVDMWSYAKRGGFTRNSKNFAPSNTLPYSPELANILGCIDEIGYTTKDGQGNREYGSAGSVNTTNKPVTEAINHRKGETNRKIIINYEDTEKFPNKSPTGRGAVKGSPYLKWCKWNSDTINTLGDSWWQFGLGPNGEWELHMFIKTEIEKQKSYYKYARHDR